MKAGGIEQFREFNIFKAKTSKFKLLHWNDSRNRFTIRLNFFSSHINTKLFISFSCLNYLQYKRFISDMPVDTSAISTVPSFTFRGSRSQQIFIHDIIHYAILVTTLIFILQRFLMQ